MIKLHTNFGTIGIELDHEKAPLAEVKSVGIW